MKKLILLLAGIYCCMSVLAQNNTRTSCNIPYHQGVSAYADERCLLDFAWPEGKKDFATVVWFHGGGLEGGSKFVPKVLTDAGYAVVAVNYRFLQKAEIHEIIDDAAAAVAWAFRNVASYGGDPARIFVSGHSAGGYLTDMIVLEKKWLEAYGIDADSIAGAFPFSGQAVTHFNVRKKMGVGALQTVVDETAPLYHVRKLDMPFFVYSGDRELEMNGRYEEQAFFWRMLRLAGCEKAYLYEFDGYSHGAMADPAFPVMVRHMNAILEGKEIAR